MKRTYSGLVLVLIILALTVTSCGSGGSDGFFQDSLHAPTLSEFSLNPNSAIQQQGGGIVQTEFIFYFEDSGGDLHSMTITVYDGNRNLLASATDQLEGSSGITAGYISGVLLADTNEVGNYTFEVYVTDSMGLRSNKVADTFTVVPPAALLSITVTPENQSIVDGETQQFTAMGTYDDSTVLNITGLVAWTSSDPDTATIEETGQVTAVRAGTTIITATLGSVSDSTDLKVLPDFEAAARYEVAEPSVFGWWLGNTAIGDLNGDGRNDVAALENFQGLHFFVYEQNSDHTLSSSQTFTTELDLTGIAIADINNDGLADLIVSGNSRTASSPLGRVFVYRQDSSTHALGSPQQYIVSTDDTAGLAAADLNNDSLPDIAVSGFENGGIVSLLFQTASGGLSSEMTYTSVAVSGWGELHVADMNSDGLNDIVLQSGAKQLAVIKQASAGNFSSTPDFYDVQTSYWSDFRSFALGDLNGDGRVDIAVADPGNDPYLNIFTQNSEGLFTRSLMATSSNVQTEVDIADVDGDGLNDIILNEGAGLGILYQAADHTFPDFIAYHLPTGTSGGTVIHQALSIGDVTEDGLLDIVTSWANEGIYVLPRLP